MLPAGAVPELAFRIRQGAVGGCLDLFHVMMSPPDERMGKAARVPDRAMCFAHCAEVPRVLPKEDQLKGNSVLLGTHNQQRRILNCNAQTLGWHTGLPFEQG